MWNSPDDALHSVLSPMSKLKKPQEYLKIMVMVISKLPPRSGSSLKAVEPHPEKKGHKVRFLTDSLRH